MEKKMLLVRLSSGEEIIGEVTETENLITIKDGYTLIPAGEGRIGMMPFMAYTKANNGVTIDKKFVMFMIEPADDLQEQVKSMGSSIVTPKKDIIV
tara:strand:+ start:316 stop:603 length:288 start_codon:yes stop_codon:yes gene_type:complete